MKISPSRVVDLTSIRRGRQGVRAGRRESARARQPTWTRSIRGPELAAGPPAGSLLADLPPRHPRASNRLGAGLIKGDGILTGRCEGPSGGSRQCLRGPICHAHEGSGTPPALDWPTHHGCGSGWCAGDLLRPGGRSQGEVPGPRKRPGPPWRPAPTRPTRRCDVRPPDARALPIGGTSCRIAPQLPQAASHIRHIRRAMLRAAQFPDTPPGTAIVKSAGW